MEEKNNTEKIEVTIVTHNGQFHADDIFAVATLCLVLEKHHTVKIIRTRDAEKIINADYVVDVGNIYDVERKRFDHHQKEGGGKRDNGIPYSSFGLVWRTYGETVVQSKEISQKIDQNLVCPIDAVDNGISISKPVFDGLKEYTIGDMFSVYKVTWKENSEELDVRFRYLVDLAKDLIKREIKILKDIQEANILVLEKYNQLKDKRLLILDTYYPIDEVFFGIPDTLLVIYPDLNDGNWCLEVVTDERFVNTRISLPESWAGKRDKELESATDVTGSIFCHKGRHFAVAKTKDAAIELVYVALKEAGK